MLFILDKESNFNVLEGDEADLLRRINMAVSAEIPDSEE